MLITTGSEVNHLYLTLTTLPEQNILWKGKKRGSNAEATLTKQEPILTIRCALSTGVTDLRMDGRTDTPSTRDATAHLKTDRQTDRNTSRGVVVCRASDFV